MKLLFFLLIGLAAGTSHAADVISCGDALSVGKEAKLSLHKTAQKRAQQEVEDFKGKTLSKPYFSVFGGEPGTPEATAALIETYWCETNSTPLHSAYYRYYSSNKSLFNAVKPSEYCKFNINFDNHYEVWREEASKNKNFKIGKEELKKISKYSSREMKDYLKCRSTLETLCRQFGKGEASKMAGKEIDCTGL